jgi:hypothetical protein
MKTAERLDKGIPDDLTGQLHMPGSGKLKTPFPVDGNDGTRLRLTGNAFQSAGPHVKAKHIAVSFIHHKPHKIPG